MATTPSVPPRCVLSQKLGEPDPDVASAFVKDLRLVGDRVPLGARIDAAAALDIRVTSMPRLRRRFCLLQLLACVGCVAALHLWYLCGLSEGASKRCRNEPVRNDGQSGTGTYAVSKATGRWAPTLHVL